VKLAVLQYRKQIIPAVTKILELIQTEG